MSGLASPIAITDQDVRTTSTSRGGELLGQVARASDGTLYVYAANASTSTALSAGKLTQGAVKAANHINRTGATYAAGVNQVSFTIGNTAITADQYTQGWLVVNAGTGAGQRLQISSHNTPSGNGTATVSLMDPIMTATAVSDSKFSLYPNIYSSTVIYAHASPNTSIPTGVPQVTVAAASTANPFNYYWALVGGECAVLADNATWVGSFDGVIASTLTDGAVGIQASATIQPTLGYSLDTLVNAEYRPVFFTGIIP